MYVMLVITNMEVLNFHISGFIRRKKGIYGVLTSDVKQNRRERELPENLQE